MNRVLLILLVLMSTSVFAQEVHFKFGMNLTDLVTKVDGEVQNDTHENKKGLGYYVGVGVDIPIKAKFVSIEPGVNFQVKGDRNIQKVNNTNNRLVDKENRHYISVPVLLKAGLDVGKDARIFAGLGPSFDFAVLGKDIHKQNINGNKLKETTKIDFKNDAVKRADMSFVFAAGLEFKKFGLGYNLSLGLLNMRESLNPDYTQKNRTHSIIASYRFFDTRKEGEN